MHPSRLIVATLFVFLLTAAGGIRAVNAAATATPGVPAPVAQVAPMPPPPGFTSTPTYGNLGLALVVFTGGTVEELGAAAGAVGASGAWVQDSTGRYQLLPVGAPPFVESSFAGAFPAPAPGLPNFPGLTAVTLVASTSTASTTVTLAMDGSTITMHVGDQFLLKLGDEYIWDVQIADQRILSRVANVAVGAGAQGVYEARAAGQTMLTAIGDLPCRFSTPACLAPSRAFRIDVVVLP